MQGTSHRAVMIIEVQQIITIIAKYKLSDGDGLDVQDL